MSEPQLKMNAILQDIIHNEDEDCQEYYGIIVDSYNDNIVDKYSRSLNDLNDKIYLAQWCNNYAKVDELIKMLTLTPYQRQKYERLRSHNIDLNETINFRILDEKYAFLDDILDMLVTDIDIQDQILSLSDARLELFRLMYSRLQIMTDFLNPYIETILQRIGYVTLATSWKNKYHFYDDLLKDLDAKIENGDTFAEAEIDTLLYLCTTSVQHTVRSYEEMQRFGQPDTIDQIEFQNLIDECRVTKDIDAIKFLLLAQIYGIHLNEAKTLCNRYDIKGLEVTNDNKDLFEMYMAIYQIVNENDPDILIELYDEFMKRMQPKKDFRRIVVFENDMRKSFAHDLNNKVFKTDDKPYTTYDGVNIYDAGVDFKMIVTAIGAYQTGFTDKENYSEYWNSPNIRSHGNCCSLIGNSNLSTATVKNVILGFSSMSDNMLLLSGTRDINSTPDSRNFNTTTNRNQQFMNADTLLDNTRGDYNELVYERRDLNSNPTFYKKNPDYIVFIEEYIDFDNMLEVFKDNSKKIEYLMRQKREQDHKWQESLKAAKDFGIPIVKINRQKVAEREFAKIKALVEEFQTTKNPELLSQIITKFESNRVGNCGEHTPIREKYFSPKNMSTIMGTLKETISGLEDTVAKNKLYFSLYKAIIEEQQKVAKCKYNRHYSQTPGIDFEKELDDIEQILTDANFDYSGYIRRKK